MPNEKDAIPQNDPDTELMRMIRRHIAEAERGTKRGQREPNMPGMDIDTSLDLIELENLAPKPGDAQRYVPRKPAASESFHAQPQKSAVAPLRSVRARKKHPLRTFFILLLLLGALLGASGVGFVYNQASKVQTAAPNEAGAAMRPSRSALLHSARVTNLLLIGVDKDEGGVARSDSMLLLSIDRDGKALKLTSFLRDSWVQMASGGEAKLNSAFAWDGAEGLCATLEQNFGVAIDHYIKIDFAGFKAVIDALGGVEVAVADVEADFIVKTTKAGKALGREAFRAQTEEKGTVLLDGELALIYCRIRKLDSDFHRTARQRKVLEALTAKLKKTPPSTLLKLPELILPALETDMRPSALTALLLGATGWLGYGTEQHSIPAKGTYKEATKKGSAALELDLDENRALLEAFIYG
ncbi:MAG: LCP family protein [Oscillospiraceae bacterium]|jgi:LCP family protein required for cell wall assembly|nr:LCP family protein [Oscillospiraceae bacterium]